MSPVVYICSFAWLGKRLRRMREQRRERRVAATLPRRLDALRASSLRDLRSRRWPNWPRRRRWVHPRTGEQLVFAGAAQPDVFAVVEGALEARSPGDPAGTVRERVGAGGVVGLGLRADRGAVGTGLVRRRHEAARRPVARGAAAIRPHTKSLAIALASVTEAEALFAEAPALAGLSFEDRLGLAGAAKPITLAPGEPVVLSGAGRGDRGRRRQRGGAGRRRAGPGHADRPGRRRLAGRRWPGPGHPCNCSPCPPSAGCRCCWAPR